MKTNKPLAILWLIFSILPLMYFPYFLIQFSSLTDMSLSSEVRNSQLGKMFIFHILIILEAWVLVASYIIYLFKTSVVPKEKKTLWVIVLIFGNVFVMPVFWYLYVWRNNNK